ncbi:hypothetical protein MNBD_GAMMA12-1416, partial [hydrothermal vent metagenome]
KKFDRATHVGQYVVALLKRDKKMESKNLTKYSLSNIEEFLKNNDDARKKYGKQFETDMEALLGYIFKEKYDKKDNGADSVAAALRDYWIVEAKTDITKLPWACAGAMRLITLLELANSSTIGVKMLMDDLKLSKTGKADSIMPTLLDAIISKPLREALEARAKNDPKGTPLTRSKKFRKAISADYSGKTIPINEYYDALEKDLKKNNYFMEAYKYLKDVLHLKKVLNTVVDLTGLLTKQVTAISLVDDMKKKAFYKLDWKKDQRMFKLLFGITSSEEVVPMKEWKKMVKGVIESDMGPLDDYNKKYQVLSDKKVASLYYDKRELKIIKINFETNGKSTWIGRWLEREKKGLAFEFPASLLVTLNSIDIFLKHQAFKTMHVKDDYYLTKQIELGIAYLEFAAYLRYNYVEKIADRSMRNVRVFMAGFDNIGEMKKLGLHAQWVRDAKLTFSMQNKAIFWGKLVPVLGTAGAIASWWASDCLYEEYLDLNNKEQAAKHELLAVSALIGIGSSLFFLADAYFIKAAMATAWVYGVPGIGWAIVILSVFIGAVILVLIGNATLTPTQLWLKHCYWGKEPYA